MDLPLQQHPDFSAALDRLGKTVRRIEIDGAAPTSVIRRFGLAFASRGPVWRDENPAALRRSELRIINAERPSDVYRKAGFRQIMTPAHIAELSLQEADWIARADGKWRNAWRKSARSRLILKHTPFDPALHAWLLAEDRAQQRRKKYRALPHGVLHAYAAVNPGRVIVFSARRKQDGDVAAMLFLHHGAAATYHLGWSSPAGREANAHHALLAHAAEHFRAKGVTRLDLGTVDTDNAPGLARFKIGSGAQVRPLGGTWLRVPGL